MPYPLATTQKKSAKIILCTLGLTAFSAAAQAAPVSYTYGGLQYIDQQLDDYDCDQDGLRAYGSLALDQSWFVQAQATDVSGNNGCGSTTLGVNGGYRIPVNSSMDFYGTLGVERTDVDAGENDTGLVAAAGVRGWLLQQLEGKAEVAHHTTYDSTTALNLGGAYWFTRAIAATLDTSLSDEGNSWAVGGRINF